MPTPCDLVTAPVTRSARTRFRRRSILSLGAALLFVAGPAFAEIPHGVISLSPAGIKVNESVLSNPNVVAVTLRQDWSALEPTEGKFDWTFLDSEVARVAAAGKKVMLRINTQTGKPAWVTSAVQAKGGKFFTFDNNGVTTTIPVFWNGTFLKKKKNMIAALGAHFTANPAVVMVVASFANAVSEDWNVPHEPEDITNWLAVGYTTTKMINTGKQIIDATMAAFPNQAVALAIGGNGNLDLTADYVAENVIANARALWPGRLTAQQNSLATFNPDAPSTDGSIWNLIWLSRPEVGAQMLYWCSDEPTYRVNGGVPGDPETILKASIDKAVGYQLQYVEIYQKDVINLPGAISYAKSKLVF